jgi:hypothetical protein
MLTLDRELFLSRREDRKTLAAAAAHDGRLAPLIAAHLEDYCVCLASEKWHRVVSGIVNIRTGEKGQAGFDIADLLTLVGSIKNLKGYEGFAVVLAGLENPTQIQSTIFEITAAEWCRSREVSVELVFNPTAFVKERVKHPDFLWRTTLGDCYCECKKANHLQNAVTARASRMAGLLDTFYKRYDAWDPSLRLDVTFGRGSTNQLHREFEWIVAQAQRAMGESNALGALITTTHVSARFRQRTEEPPRCPDTLRQSLASIGTVATELRAATYLTVTMDIAGYRSAAAARLVREARTQLPESATGLIFVEGVGRAAAGERLNTLLTSPAYSNTPWVSLWMFGQCIGAVWRNHQPFDAALLK